MIGIPKLSYMGANPLRLGAPFLYVLLERELGVKEDAKPPQGKIGSS